MNDKLPDALADALGKVVADLHREWKRDVERISAESRVIIAELRADVAGLKVELRAKADEHAARVAEVLANVKNGEDGKDGTSGHDGKSVDAEEVAALIKSLVSGAVETIPVPKDGEDGKSVTVEDVAPLIAAEVEKVTTQLQETIAASVSEQVEKIPPAQNGKDADPELIRGLVAEVVAAIPAPQNGKDADPAEMAAVIAAQINKAISGLPVPKDGEPGTPGAQGRDADPELIAEMVAKQVAVVPVQKGDPGERGLEGPSGKDGRDGKDAVSVADVLVGRSGLIITMTDGTTRTPGVVFERDEISSTSEITDEEFQRRIELATGHEAVAQRFSGLRQANGTRSLQVMREAFKESRPAVNVTVPITMPRGKEVTTVTRHDKDGRIVEFEKTLVDEAAA